jgi:hypothetical protein
VALLVFRDTPLSIWEEAERPLWSERNALRLGGAVKYLCLVYHEEKILDGLPKAEMDVLVQDSLDLCDELVERGRFIAAQALQPVRTATTLRVRNGKVTLTDGPFAETKEQLGGFFFIEASDLDEALKIAARIPGGRIGSVEVRPIWELEQTPWIPSTAATQSVSTEHAS